MLCISDENENRSKTGTAVKRGADAGADTVSAKRGVLSICMRCGSLLVSRCQSHMGSAIFVHLVSDYLAGCYR